MPLLVASESAAAEGAAEWTAPSMLARVIPNGISATTLGAPGAVDVFVTTPEAIEGLDAAGIAGRLGIPESPTGFQVIQFRTPESVVTWVLRIVDDDRGRDAHCWAPPAQNRASPTQALGFHLGCITTKRSFGQG